MTTPTTKRNPWSWIPTLYFAEGLPYVAVMTIAVIMYKRLGLSNTEIALYTSWLYLPWTIKPLWSPFVDLVKTKRAWIIAMQGFIAAGFAGIAFFIPTAHYVQLTLAFFWLLAFSSAILRSSNFSGIGCTPLPHLRFHGRFAFQWSDLIIMSRRTGTAKTHIHGLDRGVDQINADGQGVVHALNMLFGQPTNVFC